MKTSILTLLTLALVLELHHPAAAQTGMPQSVVGNGGGPMTGTSYQISGGTLGQAAIGVLSGPSNIHHIGFWHPAFLLTPVEETETLSPSVYRLGQNYPNPFNPVTTVEFSVPERAHVVIKIYDVSGREVMTVVDGDLDPGHHRRVVDAEGLPSGIYFCRMTAEGFLKSTKLVLLK